MKFYIEDVLVVFPYPYVYPEQLEYMTELKRGLDRGGHVVLEMPSGTGKTISLLSLLVAYLSHHRAERRKVSYCTRTVQEMTKTMEELRRLLAHWAAEGEALPPLRGVCLTARKHLCVLPAVSALTYPNEVDAACRRATAPWVAAGSASRCEFFDALEAAPPELPPGVYSLDDMRRFGEERGVCPYYLVRRALPVADIIVHSYLYIVDPVVSAAVREHLSESTIVVMDEGHNVDDVCIEAMSMVITKSDVAAARDRNMPELRAAANEMLATNRQRLQDEYARLVNGLALAQAAREADRDRVPPAAGAAAAPARRVPFRARSGRVDRPAAAAQQQQPAAEAAAPPPPAAAAVEAPPPAAAAAQGRVVAPQLAAGLAEEAIPGCLRQADHFLQFLGRLVDFAHRLVTRITRTYTADPIAFLTKVRDECAVEVKHLRFVDERLRTLLTTLQITDSHAFRHVQHIAHLYTTLAQFSTDDRHERPGFVVVCEAHDPQRPHVADPVLRLVCVDASLAVRDVFAKYRSVVLTSGTLSPLDIYPKILGFTPVASRSFQMTLSRRCIAPVIVTRGSDQASLVCEDLTSSFKVRQNAAAQAAVSKAYSSLLMDLATTVPDGIVCFFTGYQYMGEVLLEWHASGFLQALAQHKLIFVETQGVEETAVALANYRRACDIGRGAIFMSIARGKIAEGIDFDRHYGRAVVMFGVPFLPPTDEPLRQRMQWMEACLSIPESEYRNFDALRQAAQCIGRVLRNKTDYGLMLLVDRRFAQNDKRRKLPAWIQQCIKENTNLSVDAAVAVARRFCCEMAQPWDHERDLGSSLLAIDTLVQRGHGAPSPCMFPPAQQPGAAAAVKREGNGDVAEEIGLGDDEDEPLHAVPESGTSMAGGARKKPRRN